MGYRAFSGEVFFTHLGFFTKYWADFGKIPQKTTKTAQNGAQCEIARVYMPLCKNRIEAYRRILARLYNSVLITASHPRKIRGRNDPRTNPVF